MGTSLEKLAKEAKQIIDKHGVVKKPENAVSMSNEEYFKLVKYAATGIPENPDDWKKDLWTQFYYVMTDVIFYRNSNLRRENLTEEEKDIIYFEGTTRPYELYESSLYKDRWFRRVTGKNTDLPLDVATKRAAEFVERLREESDEGFDAKDCL